MPAPSPSAYATLMIVAALEGLQSLGRGHLPLAAALVAVGFATYAVHHWTRPEPPGRPRHGRSGR